MTVSLHVQPARARLPGESREGPEGGGFLGLLRSGPECPVPRYGSTRTLGIVLGEHLTYAFDDLQAVSFLAGISKVCAERGYGLLIVPNGQRRGRPRPCRRRRGRRVRRLNDHRDDPVLEAVCGTRRAVVVHGGPAREGTTLVGIDNRAAARAMGAEVFAGTRRPAVLNLPVNSAA